MDSINVDQLLEKWSIEFKKGYAKPLLLLFLRNQETYPYRLTREINEKTHGAINIAGSNIYPLLSSMKQHGLIESAQSEESNRTLYSMTPKGIDYLQTLSRDMIDFMELILKIIEEKMS